MKRTFFRRQIICSLALFGYMAVPLIGQALPLSFKFPEKSHAEVTERVLRGGQEMKFAYDLDIQRASGGGMTVTHSNARVVEFQGKALTAAEQTPMIFMALTVAGKTSSLEINAQGGFESVANVKEIVSAFEKVFERANVPDPTNEDAKKQMLEVVRSAKGQSMMGVAAATAWSNCVEGWIGFDVKPGATESGFIDSETIPGLSVRCERTLTHHGKVPTNPLLWHLKIQSRLADDAYGKKVIEHLRTINPEGAARLNPDDIQKSQPVTTVEGYIDPETLLPHWIKVQIKVETGATSNTDEFEYEFKWVLKQ
jgi:hypothetical protein